MRHKKIGGKFKKTVAVGLIVSMALGSATLRSFAKDVSDDSTSGSKTESSDSDSKSSVTSEEYSVREYQRFIQISAKNINCLIIPVKRFRYR